MSQTAEAQHFHGLNWGRKVLSSLSPLLSLPALSAGDADKLGEAGMWVGGGHREVEEIPSVRKKAQVQFSHLAV